MDHAASGTCSGTVTTARRFIDLEQNTGAGLMWGMQIFVKLINLYYIQYVNVFSPDDVA